MARKLKKTIALILAFVICMSMGMSVFAAGVGTGSVTDPTVPEEEELPWMGLGSGTDKDGNKVTSIPYEMISEEVEAVLKDDEKVKDILTDAGYVLEGDEDVVVLGAANISLIDENWQKMEVPEGGVDLEIMLDGWTYEEVKNLKDGDTLYVLHQKSDGTWEVLEGKAVVKDGMYYAAAHFDSLSPVAVIKVMSDGKVAVLENNKKVGEVDPQTGEVKKVDTVKKSPKTGR